jgi:hypothetical protein
MGRTAIKFDVRACGSSGPRADACDGIPYSKGSAEQIANVCNTQLRVTTVPFLQQDPIVGMCATASLWVASQVLSSKFDLHKFPYIDISRQATQPSLAPLIATPPDDKADFARGLGVPEICGALVRTGAFPLVITPRLFSHLSKGEGEGGRSGRDLGRCHLRDQLYTFVESELPVIVCLQQPSDKLESEYPSHAVTAIGHVQPFPKAIKDVESCTVASACPHGSPAQHLVSLSVKRFFVHNDSYGPFDRLDFVEPSTLSEAQRKAFTCPVRLSQGDDGLYDVQALIVPMPPYVKNRPDFVLQDASIRFSRMFFDKGFEARRHTVIWRMLLVKGSRFKQSLIARRWPQPLIEAYGRVHLPKYIWLCEFTIVNKDHLAQFLGVDRQRRSRPVHGEFIFDTTTAYYHTKAVVLRFGPYFIKRNDVHMLPKERRLRVMTKSRLDGVSPDLELPCFTGSAQ